MATLTDFKISTRLRLGELAAGTYGIEDYEDQDSVDELKFELNAAQISVCRDIWTQQWMPFRRLRNILPIISGETVYTLPRDYIQMVSCYHKKPDQTPIELKPKILSKYREIDDGETDYSGHSESWYQYYEVSGQIGEIIVEGVVTWADDAFQFAADNTSLAGVRVGDIVNNLTDGSQGVITQFGSGIATLGDELHGGRSNRMQYGDEFSIQTREESRFALETWPAVHIASPKLELTETLSEDGRLIFQPKLDGTIENIELRLPQSLFLEDGLLEDVSEQTRFLLTIREVDATTYAPGDTLDIIGFQDVMAGINELNVIESEISKGRGSLQFDRSKTYDAYLTSPEYPLGVDALGIDFSFTINDLSLLQPTTDFLIVNYVKRMSPFLIDESVCELMPELHELVIEKAVISLLRKKDPKMVNASILQHYKALVKDAKDFLASLLPPDAIDIDDEYGGIQTHSPGMSSYYW